MNPRPASYKDAALTVELRASESRAGGNRTHSGRLKVCCAAFTPRPHEVGLAYAFQSPSACHCFFSFLFVDSVVALRVELSATWLSAGFGQPALDYHFESGNSESNRDPPVPKTGVLPSAPVPKIVDQSERSDLNRRSPGPRPGATTRLRYVLVKLSQAARMGIEPISPP